MNDPIVRSVPFELTRAADEGDGLTLEGYAATFDTPTRIDNPFEGKFDEQIAPTAFDKSIGDRAQWPLMMFQHGRHPLIGPLPIGVITVMRADSRGLFVRARLTDNWLISPVRDAIAAGAVNGMSFRAEPIRNTVDKNAKPPLVTRQELRLVELGPVVQPQYETTAVTVRSREIRDALEDPAARRDLAVALLALDRQETDTHDVAAGIPENGNTDGTLEHDRSADVDAPPDGHPFTAAVPDAPPDGHPFTAAVPDAPPETGHPSSEDAPPDSGHPSPPEPSSMSDAYAQAQLARVNGLIDIADRSAL